MFGYYVTTMHCEYKYIFFLIIVLLKGRHRKFIHCNEVSYGCVPFTFPRQGTIPLTFAQILYYYYYFLKQLWSLW